MKDNDNSKSNDSQQQQEGSDAKVLPFRRPTPQPTLPRRNPAVPGATARGKGKRPESRGEAWKGKVFQVLQLAILAAAVVLALKNCGKI
ncbi:MAG: hypothetical protein FJY29_08455 [Betaproteobacteria bacterium]|nr:hypothetical protein [Betaproteobacteria bacterium]